MWDATNGTWVPDPEAAPKQEKLTAPPPPGQGASEDARRDWLRVFSTFDGIEYSFPDDYRKAYKKAKRPVDDSARRVKQRRERPHQQRVHRLGGKKRAC